MVLPAYIDESTGEITDGEAWVAIASTTLGSDAATVTFTSPADGGSTSWDQFMDLVIVSYTRSDAGSAIRYLHMNFNNSSGARHAVQWLYGDGSAAYASASSGSTSELPIGVVLGGGAAANEFSSTVTHLFDINSGKYKSGITMSAGDSNGDGEVLINAVTWNDQAPITEIDLTTYTDDFVAGCTFSLFGVLPRMVA